MTKSIWLLKLLSLKINRITIHYSGIQGRADELVIQAKELNYRKHYFELSIYHCNSMVCLKWYVKSDEEHQSIDDYFNKHFEIEKKQFGFREKYWFYNANLWHSFLVQDFLAVINT
jgi:hypothetical protein